ncbi:glycosyl hydrolase family 8 [Companilactobacillus futsaii]|uniref:glycosyl hydrolase family 8 n=1 Tax=Companilactobacillus futsaii TaxID=938155 RepID=UPI00189F7D59|nr:glycosyl hydrolase family 8 [Companilactobacillus futsaii]
MFRRHKYQWLISGLIILVSFAIGIAIYNTQSETRRTGISSQTIQSQYQLWKKFYLRGDKTQKFVKTNNGTKNQTLSEAQGYGMLITVMAAQQGFDNQRVFNQLTNYYLNHRISSQDSLMAWRQNQQGNKMVSTKAEKTSATDGDLDIAYALILADKHWGSKGKINYHILAIRLLNDIYSQEINVKTGLPKLGNWTKGRNNNVVRTSDLISAYFREFASYTKDGKWTKTMQNSQFTLQKLSNQNRTGLMPDFVMISGNDLNLKAVKANQVASKYDAQYAFNACRIPWRVAYDYQMNHSRISKNVAGKIDRFFETQKKITAIYTLNGRPVENYENEAFCAPVVYSAEVLGNQVLKKRYKKVLINPIVDKDYYPATIQMLTLLAIGNMNNKTR